MESGKRRKRRDTSWDRSMWQSSLDTADFSRLRPIANLDNVFTEFLRRDPSQPRENCSYHLLCNISYSDIIGERGYNKVLHSKAT